MNKKIVPFSPMHGLAALGAGGLAVSFFVWLLFLTPHAGIPVPTFESLARASTLPGMSTWIVSVKVVIAVLLVTHFALLFWWLRAPSQLAEDKRQALYAGEASVTQMITPLVLAMSVNAGFVGGLVFVPGLWAVKEALFPFALLAFFALFVLAITRWLRHNIRARAQGFTYQGKGLLELLSTFALAMITVGFSASAAMSSTPLIYSAGIALAILSGIVTLASALTVVRARLSTINAETILPGSTGSLLMAVPITTVLGIAVYRLLMAGNHHFGLGASSTTIALVLGFLFSFQLLVFIVGVPVIHRSGGFKELLRTNPNGASLSLVCPGVGLFVLGMFFVTKGLAEPGFISAFIATTLYTLLGVVQALTLTLFIYLLMSAMPRTNSTEQVRSTTHNPTFHEHGERTV